MAQLGLRQVLPPVRPPTPDQWGSQALRADPGAPHPSVGGRAEPGLGCDLVHRFETAYVYRW